MIKYLLSTMLCVFFIHVHCQSFTEDFDDVATLTSKGWFQKNNSVPIGSGLWFQGDSGAFGAYNGAANAYIACNFASTNGGEFGAVGIISNWLVTPNRTLRNGDVFTFFTRKIDVGQDYPDHLEVRMSTNGASTNVGTGSQQVGDFSRLLISINPQLVVGGYPTEWTQYSVTVSGLSAPTSGRFAFRYYVTDAGVIGSNSDYIGIDNVIYTPTNCPDVIATSSQVDISCHGGNDGSASVTPSGGSDFTYVWSHDSSNTTNLATNLSAGSYSCKITNECGAYTVKNFTITQPSPLLINLVKDILDENPAENTITANPSGGSPGYSYEWSNGATTASVSNLSLGSQWVKVTDANLCQVTKDFYITDGQLKIILEDTITVCVNEPLVLSPLVLPEIEADNIGNDFTGAFAPENWQQSSNNSNGSINFNGTTGLTFVSGNNNSTNTGYNKISTNVQYSREISFNWNYSAVSGPYYNYPQILIDNQTFNLSGYNMGGSNTQSGTHTIYVPAGSTFSIKMVTADNNHGAATMVLSNFTYTHSYIYLWMNEDNQVVGDQPTYEPSEPGTYTLTATDPSGNSVSKSIEVIWQVVEVPQADLVHFFADGDTVADIPVQGQNLVWQNAMGVIPETTPLQNLTSYMVTQTINGCIGSPAQIMAVNDNIVTWTGTEWINGLPSENVNVRVMGDLKVGTNVADFSAAYLFISPEGSVTISDGHTVRMSQRYVNESNLGAAGFVVESGGNLLQLSQSVNDAMMGDITIIRDSNPMKRLDYTLWSSPVKEQNLFGFSPETVNGITNYPGSIGRIYVYDGFANAYVNPNPFTATTVMNIGVGYLFRAPNNYHATDEVIYKGVFTGIPNNGYMNIPAFVGSYTSVGNPYPSNIDANLFLAGNPGASALYFWNNTDVAGNNYATYTMAGGTAAGGGSEEPDGIITVGQGFIVESTGPILNFNNWMRVGAPGTFFKANETERHRFWLDLTNVDTERINQILISYMDGATNGIDNQIDGKQFGNETSALYSLINDEKFAIQGRALPFEDSDVIPLGFKAVESGQFNISLNNFDGLFTEGNLNIFLNDKQLNVQHNLMESAYSFKSEAGEFNERFEIIYGTDGTMGIEDLNANAIQIYTQDQNIFVSSKQQKILSVELYDLSGKNIHSNYQVNANLYEIKSNTKGVLVVKVQTQNGEIVTKKVISK